MKCLDKGSVQISVYQETADWDRWPQPQDIKNAVRSESSSNQEGLLEEVAFVLVFKGTHRNQIGSDRQRRQQKKQNCGGTRSHIYRDVAQIQLTHRVCLGWVAENYTPYWWAWNAWLGGHWVRHIDETMLEDFSFFIINLWVTGAPQQPFMTVRLPSWGPHFHPE